MQNYRNNARQTNGRPAFPSTTISVVPKEDCKDMVLAMAYVPWQKWQNIYDAEKSFCRGTIFQDLDLPFRGIGGCQK